MSDLEKYGSGYAGVARSTNWSKANVQIGPDGTPRADKPVEILGARAYLGPHTYDPSGRRMFVNNRLEALDAEGSKLDSRDTFNVEVRPPEAGETPNLVSSLCAIDGMHKAVLDIDFPARLVPSRTPGHFHLFLDGLLIADKAYGELLEALKKAGVIQNGIVMQYEAAGATFARVPKEPTP